MAGCVSIVVPTSNNQKTIGYTLESITCQTYKALETILVDNFSRDGTFETARAYGAKTILHSGRVSSARNLGLALSTGEYVLFIDGDQTLESTCVEECVALCSNGGADMVKIPETFVGLHYWGECLAMLKNVNFDLGMKREGEAGFYPRFWRRRELVEIGGFDKRLSWGEDKECYLRAKRCGLVSKWSRSRIVHIDMASPGLLARKRIRYAAGIRTYKKTVGPYSKDPYLAYGEWGVRVLPEVLSRSRHPKLALGVLVLMVLIAGAVVLRRA